MTKPICPQSEQPAPDRAGSRGDEPAAWMVKATGGNSGGGESLWFTRNGAEDDAAEWRINGATARIVPLYLSPASAPAQGEGLPEEPMRYDLRGADGDYEAGMEPSYGGEYVRYEDYDALRQAAQAGAGREEQMTNDELKVAIEDAWRRLRGTSESEKSYFASKCHYENLLGIQTKRAAREGGGK